MNITVASGKGGTGKTSLAVNLAYVAERPVQLLDCDVEEPNAHIFLRGVHEKTREVAVPVPEIDAALCNGCRRCARFCAFHALVSFGAVPLVFPDLCHGCGGCVRVCRHKAIHEIERRIGTVEISRAGPVTLVEGRLDVGIATAAPLIRAVKKEAAGDLVICDAPPGTSCAAVAALGGSDYAVLVAEPTRFGLNDFKLAVATVRKMAVPFGAVVNRAAAGMTLVRDYCRSEGIEVLGEIPDDRKIAEVYSEGRIAAEALPHYREVFRDLLRSILSKQAAS
jgi:MinD superfamily P-loop ATPase